VRGPWGAAAYLESTPIGPDYALPPLDEAFLITHGIPYLNDVASNVIVQDFDSLPNRDASCKQFDDVSRFKNDIRVICLSRRPHRH
jgi:hypothetical protein